MDYAFYHLSASPLEKALPRLMEKAYASGGHAVILAPDEQAMERLNQALWTYTPNSFLPHGSRLDPHPEVQPIYLTTRLENPNGAQILVLTGGMDADEFTGFTRVLDLFDGAHDHEVANARTRFKKRKAEGHALAYWQQTDKGGWEKKGD